MMLPKDAVHGLASIFRGLPGTGSPGLFSVAALRLFFVFASRPTACAVGFILAPLCGCHAGTSGLDHSLNAGFHLVLVDKVSAISLLQTFAHGSSKARVAF
jgi:hypothetical protein